MKNLLDSNLLDIWRLFLTSHSKIIRQIDKQLADANEIPLNWYDVLIELYEAPEHKLRMSEVAERVLLTRSGLTRLVDKLETNGYIIREIDPQDRRGFYASITDEGIQAMRDAWKIYSQAVQEFYGQHIPREQIPMLQKIYSEIIVHLDNEK